MRKLLAILSLILLTSCGVQWQIATLNHVAYDPLYNDVVQKYPERVDTLSYSDFRWKLRTDFNFRWNYAQYMMDQPLSFYYRNYPNYLGNAHDFWWNSNQYWTDWAFNYPFNSWYWSRWNRPWMGNAYWGYGWYGNTWNNHWWRYGYSGWYGHNSLVWGNTWRNDKTYVHINGRRGSSNINYNGTGRTNSIIQTNTNTRGVRSNNTSRIRVYDNPTNTTRNYRRSNDNNNIRINNTTRNNNWKPRVPNNVNNRRPVINNPRPVRVEQNTRTNYNTNRSTNVRSANSRSNGTPQIKRRR